MKNREMRSYPGLLLQRSGATAQLILTRPEARNAFNAELIAALSDAARLIAADTSLRVVVLSGQGKHFCGGADLMWMQAAGSLDAAANENDAYKMGEMFDALDSLPQVLIGRIQGAALGGGAGLAAVCDHVIAAETAFFGFPEVRLGLIPAVIAPYVVEKIGLSQARSLFCSGERFAATTARAIGFIHQITTESTLDTEVAKYLEGIYAAAPGAIRAIKTLLRNIPLPREQRLSVMAQAIAKRRISPEGQAGINAFLAKTPAPWAESCSAS